MVNSFKEYATKPKNQHEEHVQAKHFDTNEYEVIPDNTNLKESVVADPENDKRIIFKQDGEHKPKGVSGLSVPKHMWEGSKHTTGMKERNQKRAEVYGAEKRDPLSVPEMEDAHKSTLDAHFAKPKHEQIAAEKDAIGRLHRAGHLDSKSTTDDSEKTDTILHEKDKHGKGYMAAACKGVAGHTVYTSGAGEHAEHKIVNTCPGQTRGCGGGVDAHGVANTSKGTCFAPQAEGQYPAAATRRSYLDQSKHDPKMTHDYILAHTHSIRAGAEKADKKDKNFVIRPNTLNENDRSTKHVVRHLNAQRTAEGKSKITSYQYSKTNELNDPENGVHVTHSNIGPKVINGETVKENVNRDNHRVNNTVTATKQSGEDLRNEQGNKTPAMHSYLVTNIPRGSDTDKEYQKHAKHIKYWDRGTKLSDESTKDTPKEGHFDGEGKPTTPDKAHHGFKVLNGRKYEYQKQHILHPRMTEVNGHKIPSDSRFKDEDHMPTENRFKSKNGKNAGGVVVTSATTSTSGERSNSSFTHRVDQHKLNHIKDTGEHEIDSPEEQESARGKEYNGDAVPGKATGTLAKLLKKTSERNKAKHESASHKTEASQKELVEAVIDQNGVVNQSAFNRGCGAVAKHTHWNMHANAISHAAKMLGRDDIKKRADDIEKQHIKDGHLTDENRKVRQSAFDDLMAHAKKVLSPENHKKLYKSF